MMSDSHRFSLCLGRYTSFRNQVHLPPASGNSGVPLLFCSDRSWETPGTRDLCQPQTPGLHLQPGQLRPRPLGQGVSSDRFLRRKEGISGTASPHPHGNVLLLL